jgi:hypothetical protein
MKRPSAAALWIEAIICFGPLSFVLFLGVLFVPFWLAMLLETATGAVPWVDGAGVSGWRIVWPVLFVLGGVIGLVGLVRLLAALSAREQSPRASRSTAIMAFLGLGTLVARICTAGASQGISFRSWSTGYCQVSVLFTYCIWAGRFGCRGKTW